MEGVPEPPGEGSDHWNETAEPGPVSSIHVDGSAPAAAGQTAAGAATTIAVAVTATASTGTAGTAAVAEADAEPTAAKGAEMPGQQMDAENPFGEGQCQGASVVAPGVIGITGLPPTKEPSSAAAGAAGDATGTGAAAALGTSAVLVAEQAGAGGAGAGGTGGEPAGLLGESKDGGLSDPGKGDESGGGTMQGIRGVDSGPGLQARTPPAPRAAKAGVKTAVAVAAAADASTAAAEAAGAAAATRVVRTCVANLGSLREGGHEGASKKRLGGVWLSPSLFACSMPKVLMEHKKNRVCHVPSVGIYPAMVEVCYGMSGAVSPGSIEEGGSGNPGRELWVQVKVPTGLAAAEARAGISQFSITPTAEVPGTVAAPGPSGGGRDAGSNGSCNGAAAVCPGVEVEVVHTFPVLLRGHRAGDKGKPQWRLTGLKDNLKGLFGWRLFAHEAVRH